MNRFAASLALALSLAGSLPAVAAGDPLPQSMGQLTSDGQVKAAIEGGLRSITKQRCVGATPCDPTTDAELNSPPVGIPQARDTMKRGIAAAIMDWCGGNSGERIWKALLGETGAMRANDPRKAALVLRIYDVQWASLKQALETRGECPTEMKASFGQDGRNPLANTKEIAADPSAPIPGLVATPGRDGLSLATAVVIKSPEGSLGAIRAEAIWILRKHPDAQKTGQSLVPHEGRKIDVIGVKLPDGTAKSYHFDVTDAFGAPTAPKP